MSDQFYDCIVTAWHLRHPNAPGKYRGFAKVIHPPRASMSLREIRKYLHVGRGRRARRDQNTLPDSRP